jgi:hypothetical protein
MARRDWLAWHTEYDDPSSGLSKRLAVVQGHIRGALDRLPAGPVQLISICAGQGRDILPVLRIDPRAEDVRARLVELDPRNVELAKEAALGLDRVEVLQADAGTTDAYVGAVPADIVLACGVFGNITQQDIEQTIATLPSLCGPGATVIWTRHRRPPDLIPTVRGWFEAAGFRELAIDMPEGTYMGIGAHSLVRGPAPFQAGQHLFSFVGYDDLRAGFSARSRNR